MGDPVFKVQAKTQTQTEFFKENKSIVVELSEAQYQRLVQAAGDAGSMSELAREMLEYGMEQKRLPTRKISFWVPREFHEAVKAQATKSKTSFKHYVHDVISDCIADLDRKKKRKSG